MLSKDQIEDMLGFHKATTEGANATLPKHTELRLKSREFLEFLDGILPEGRVKNVAITQFEDTSMWAHKAIAGDSPLIAE